MCTSLTNHLCSVHIGKNDLGNTFGMALQDYDTIVAHPFQQFLRGVYSEYSNIPYAFDRF
jgi:hypothetical protein